MQCCLLLAQRGSIFNFSTVYCIIESGGQGISESINTFLTNTKDLVWPGSVSPLWQIISCSMSFCLWLSQPAYVDTRWLAHVVNGGDLVCLECPRPALSFTWAYLLRSLKQYCFMIHNAHHIKCPKPSGVCCKKTFLRKESLHESSRRVDCLFKSLPEVSLNISEQASNYVYMENHDHPWLFSTIFLQLLPLFEVECRHQKQILPSSWKLLGRGHHY